MKRFIRGVRRRHPVLDIQVTRSPLPEFGNAISVSADPPPSNAAIRCEKLRVDEIVSLATLEVLPEELDKLVVSMRETGPVELIRVRPATLSDNTIVSFVTISGAVRLEAMRRAEIKEVLAIIDFEPRSELLEERALASNHDRRDKHFITRAEEALRLADLRLAKAPHSAEPPPGGQQPHDKRQSARARVLGVSSDTVARYEIVAGLAAEVKSAARTAGISQNKLLKIARIENIEDQLDAVANVGGIPRQRTRKQRAGQEPPVTTSVIEGESPAEAIDTMASDLPPPNSSKNLLSKVDPLNIPPFLERRDALKAFQILIADWRQSDLSRRFETAPAEAQRLFVREISRSASLPEDSHE